MGKRFWIKRYAVALLLAFGMIVLGQLLRGRGLEHALVQGAIWAPIATAVYIAVAWYKSWRCRIAKLSLTHERKPGPDPRPPKFNDPDFNDSVPDSRTKP